MQYFYQCDDFAVSIGHKTPSIVGVILCFLWFAGICMMVFGVIRSLLHLHKIIRSSLPLQNDETRNLYYECLSEAGIRSEIPIYSTAFLKSPAIIGFLKPRIFLPIHTISNYDADSMRFMLLHELQHFRHKDLFVNNLVNLSEILYWFNPFVRYALSEIRCEREIACDCSVLQILKESEKQSNRQKMQSRLASALTMAIVLVLLPVFPSYANRQERYDFHEENKNVTYVDLNSEFGKYKGSFVLYASTGDAWTIYNKEAALLGLESGIITPEHSKMVWNGEDYPFDAWESDHDLNSAMQSSVNWYFQNIDNIAGMDKVKSYFQEIGYGNQQTGLDTDWYWTDFSLQISPVEQVELLKKFYHNDFGFSEKNINAVKEAIVISSTPTCILSGKTGTGRVDGQDVNGWFVGYIKKSGHVYYFATNIQGAFDATGSAAAQVSLSVLSNMGLWSIG